MPIIRISDMPVSLYSDRSLSLSHLSLNWMNTAGVVSQPDGGVMVSVSGPYGIAMVVLTVDVVDETVAVAEFCSDLEDAYYNVFGHSINNRAL